MATITSYQVQPGRGTGERVCVRARARVCSGVHTSKHSVLYARAGLRLLF